MHFITYIVSPDTVVVDYKVVNGNTEPYKGFGVGKSPDYTLL